MIHVAYVYILFPFLLFCVGWLRWYYAMGMAVILIASYILSIRNTKEYIAVDIKKHTSKIIIALSVIIILIFFSGIGEYSYQVEDHLFRNAVFHDLVTHRWPYRLNERGNIPGLHRPLLYIYYIIYWFPAAFAGKIFGWEAAKFSLFLWTILGTILTFYFLCRLFRKMSLKILFLFMFLNSLYIFVSFIKFPILSVITSDYKIWSGNMNMGGSDTDNLYWIYNQTVTALLILALILNNIPKQNIGFLYALCYLHGPFCFLGFFPFLCIILYKDIVLKKQASETYIKRIIQPYLTFQNIIGSITVFLVGYWYLSGSPAVQSLYIEKVSLRYYITFILVMFGFISMLIFSKYKKDPFFYTVLIMLSILPLIGMGTIQPFTFCARVSIAPTFILMILVTRYILEEPLSIRKKLVIAYVFLAALDTACEVGRSVFFTIAHYVDPLAINTIIYERAGQWSNWKNLVPPKSEWKDQNFNKLDFMETQDTTVTPNLPYFEMQSDSTFFNKYLLKQNLDKK